MNYLKIKLNLRISADYELETEFKNFSKLIMSTRAFSLDSPNAVLIVFFGAKDAAAVAQVANNLPERNKPVIWHPSKFFDCPSIGPEGSYFAES